MKPSTINPGNFPDTSKPASKKVREVVSSCFKHEVGVSVKRKTEQEGSKTGL